MINIEDKKECNGCCACVDVCPVDAIRLVTDDEGFWYPQVDQEKCIDCSLCDQVCPELQSKSASLQGGEPPVCYAANNKDIDTRVDSTSGGIFSALAEEMFAQGGNVSGAVYRADFSIQHIISNEPKDLVRLRSSKYAQSNCEGLYKGIRARLIAGEKVLACGCPCQMAGLRLFLKKEYENLIIVDFICRGINSPMVYRKHLDSLEERFGSKVVYAKAKNKERGWRSLTFKATFENGESYYGNGQEDDFTRGYLQTGYYCRPSCFDCKFKGMPRIADLTMGDFWGVEKVAPELDDNKGTSLVMCNTKKGVAFFEKVKCRCDSKEVGLADLEPGNRSLYQSLQVPQEKRADFFRSLHEKSFAAVAKKIFPKRKRRLIHILRVLKSRVKLMISSMGFSPRTWCQFFWLNFLRKNSKTNWKKMHLFIPTRYCVFDISPSAEITAKGAVIFGHSKVRGSRLESRLRMDPDTKIIFNDRYTQYAGADIQIFSGGVLEFDGGPAAGMNIHAQIICADKIKVGRSTLIGRNVVLRDYDAHHISQKGYKIKAPIEIGQHCWIGEGSLVSKGVIIEDGSIVAARSWVIKKVKSRTLVAGSPAMPMNKDIEWRV